MMFIAYNTLLLASSSQSRQELLRKAHIVFTVIGHSADEAACGISDPLPLLVAKIARWKMDHAIMPVGVEGATYFVLSADTLSMNTSGEIVGKPIDHEDAMRMLRLAQKGPMITGTAFCLDKKIYRDGTWHIQERIEGYASGEYAFYIPDHCFGDYFAHSKLYLSASGAIAIEDYGIQYCKEIRGSYSAIVGLPLYELWQALERIGYFNKTQ